MDASRDLGEVGPAVPRPTKSVPGLGTGSPTLTTGTPSIVRNWVSSGTRTTLSQDPRLTALLQNADNEVSDSTQSFTKKASPPKPRDIALNQGVAPSDTKIESGLGSVMYASTKVVIDVVKESSDVFPLLKSVAGGLSAVLKHYDVCSTSPPTLIHNADHCSSKQQPIDEW